MSTATIVKIAQVDGLIEFDLPNEITAVMEDIYPYRIHCLETFCPLPGRGEDKVRLLLDDEFNISYCMCDNCADEREMERG